VMFLIRDIVFMIMAPLNL
jgi:hypothetical protein